MIFISNTAVELEVRANDVSGNLFIVQHCFGYPGYFVSPYEFEYCSFKICVKNCAVSLMGIAKKICRLLLTEFRIFN